jgi:hypothetical protein
VFVFPEDLCSVGECTRFVGGGFNFEFNLLRDQGSSTGWLARHMRARRPDACCVNVDDAEMALWMAMSVFT